MDSDGCHFNASLTARGKVTKTMSTDHNPFEEKREPKQNQTKVCLLTSGSALITARLNWPATDEFCFAWTFTSCDFDDLGFLPDVTVTTEWALNIQNQSTM